MDPILNYFVSVIPIYVLEIIAAITGTYFLYKNNKSDNDIRLLVFFLWFTVFIELIASYAIIGFFSKYKYFAFIEGTNFQKNTWIFNCFIILEFIIYIHIFKNKLNSIYWKKIFNKAIILFAIVSVLNIIFSDVFFEKYSQLTIIFGTILLLMCVFRFYYELLNSDDILSLKNHLLFYISVGILVFYLCFTPLSIFSNYYNSDNRFFMKVYSNGLLFANILKYIIFSLGFIITAKSSPNKEEILN